MKKTLLILFGVLFPLIVLAVGEGGFTLKQGGIGWTTSTPGDLLMGTTSSMRYSRLAIGDEGTCLGVSGGTLAYVTCGTGGGGNWATTSEQNFWNTTSTWAYYDTNWNRNYNATTTLNGFTPGNYLLSADFNSNWATQYNATTTKSSLDISHNLAVAGDAKVGGTLKIQDDTFNYGMKVETYGGSEYLTRLQGFDGFLFYTARTPDTLVGLWNNDGLTVNGNATTTGISNFGNETTNVKVSVADIGDGLMAPIIQFNSPDLAGLFNSGLGVISNSIFLSNHDLLNPVSFYMQNDSSAALISINSTSSDDILNFTGATAYKFDNDLTVESGKGITLGGVYRTTWPTGGGGGTDVNWVWNPVTDILTPATSTSGILVNGNSTTTNHFAALGGNSDQWNLAYASIWSNTDEQNFWNTTSTWSAYDTNWNRNYNATTTLNGFTPTNYLSLTNWFATTTWAGGQDLTVKGNSILATTTMSFDSTIGNETYVKVSNYSYSGGLFTGNIPLISFVSPNSGGFGNIGLFDQNFAVIQSSDSENPVISFLAKDWNTTGNVANLTYTTTSQIFAFNKDLFIDGNATSSHFAADEICIAGECQTSWPSSGWTISDERDFWNGTSTWAGFQSEWNNYTNASTTIFTEADNISFWNTTSTWSAYDTNWSRNANATSTYPGFQSQFDTALNATTTLDLNSFGITNLTFTGINTSYLATNATGLVVATTSPYKPGADDVAVTDGGTGMSVYTTGDILYASGATTLAGLADVSVGSYLRSGGAGVAPLWSTLKLPNTGTAFRLPVYTSSNTMGELAAVGATGQYLAGKTDAIPEWTTFATTWNTNYNATTTKASLTISHNLMVTGNATSSHFAASEICLNNDCKTAWPTGGSGGSSNWEAKSWGVDLTPTSTSAGIWVNASSTFNSTLRINGRATTTLGLWAGSGGTSRYVNMVGGDIFVEDDLEVADRIYIGSNSDVVNYLVGRGDIAMAANADTDDYLYFETNSNNPGMRVSGGGIVNFGGTNDSTDWEFEDGSVCIGSNGCTANTTTDGYLSVEGDLTVGANATTSGKLVVGNGKTESANKYGIFTSSLETTSVLTGNYGVFASSTNAGTGTFSVGVLGSANNIGPSSIGSYGVYGNATGINSGTNYGVYGKASGATVNNYAGYFEGNLHTTANFTIDGNATTTGNMVVGADGGVKKGCLAIRSSNEAWTYMYFNGTTQVISTSDCSGAATSTLIIGR